MIKHFCDKCGKQISGDEVEKNYIHTEYAKTDSKKNSLGNYHFECICQNFCYHCHQSIILELNRILTGK